MNTPARLPPVRVIEKALRTTTARLLVELADPAQRAPQWNSFEWAVARAVSAMQGISGQLYSRLAWQGPPDWQEFLGEQRAHIEARAANIRELRARLEAQARAAGIAYIGLKGCALLDLGLYAAGERPMSDIDLLVKPGDLPAMQDVVTSLGYQNVYTTDRHAVFGPERAAAPRNYGEHRDHPLRIELHPRISETLPISVVDITRRLWPVAPRPGCNPYASRAALLSHVMLHAAGSMRAHALRALHLCDIARIAGTLSEGDWDDLTRCARRDGWWMYPTLVSAECLFPGSLPAAPLARLRSHCPAWLRLRMERNSIYRLSWSNLKIPAVAGLEWCRSPREVLWLIRGRIWPDGSAQKPAAAEPHLQHFPWYHMSRAERLARWVFTRPARAHTLFVVSAALGP